MGDPGGGHCVFCLGVPVLIQPLPPGAEGFTTQEDQEMLSRIEKQLKRRFAIGSQVSEHSIVQDFIRQVGLGPCEGWGWETKGPRLLLGQ